MKAWESFDFLLRGGDGLLFLLRRGYRPSAEGDGLLFLLRRGYRPSAEGERLTFSFPKRKSYKKKLATLQVDRCDRQLCRSWKLVSENAVRLFRLHLHPKQIAFKVRFTKWLFQFVGRVGAYPSARLAHASARRMGTDRSGAWGVGCGFWGRLQRERRVCWSVAVFKFCLGSVSVQNSEMSVGDGASTSREYIQNLHFIPEKG